MSVGGGVGAEKARRHHDGRGGGAGCGNSGNFLFHMAFLNRPQFTLVVKSYELGAGGGGGGGVDAILDATEQLEPSIDCLSSTKTVGFAFLKNCGLFPVGICIISREKSSQVS